MDLRARLKANQATTETVAFNEDGLALQLRRFSMAESSRYFELSQIDSIQATLFMLKTVVLDVENKPYFNNDDDELITGSIDSVLSPVIKAFWEFQNKPGKT